MKKNIFKELKNNIATYISDYKVLTKVGDFDRKSVYFIMRLLEIVDNTPISSFVLDCIKNMELTEARYASSAISLLDDVNGKRIVLVMKPNFKNPQEIIVKYKENGVMSFKQVKFDDDEICMTEVKRTENQRIRAIKKYKNNELTYEKLIHTSLIDADNYKSIIQESHIDNNEAFMKVFYRSVEDEIVANQGVNYYKGYLYESANFKTNNSQNIFYVSSYLRDKKEEISNDEYYESLDKTPKKDNILKFVK